MSHIPYYSPSSASFTSPSHTPPPFSPPPYTPPPRTPYSSTLSPVSSLSTRSSRSGTLSPLLPPSPIPVPMTPPSSPYTSLRFEDGYELFVASRRTTQKNTQRTGQESTERIQKVVQVVLPSTAPLRQETPLLPNAVQKSLLEKQRILSPEEFEEEREILHFLTHLSGQNSIPITEQFLVTRERKQQKHLKEVLASNAETLERLQTSEPQLLTE